MKKTASTIMIALLLQGCATAYQKVGISGGHTETQLDENVFEVSFHGNGYTSRKRAKDFALLRSAEIALENGYQYFAIINTDSYASRNTYITPSHSHTTFTPYGSANTTTTGGQAFTIAKPSSSNTIFCFKEKPHGVFTYNAKIIYKNIRQKYKLD